MGLITGMAVGLAALAGAFLYSAAGLVSGEPIGTIADADGPEGVMPTALPSVRTGSGFVVNDDGVILTNAHVIEGCLAVSAGPYAATRIIRDQQNDMALLFVDTDRSLSALRFSPEPTRLGSSALAFGYPLQDLLAPSLNVTEGVISSLAGAGGDTRFVQMSAPVQLGNSGGPLVDKDGNVVGMVTEKLDAIAVAALVGNIPEGVGFALRREAILAFLSANGVEASIGRSLLRNLDVPDIADRVAGSVFPVSCTREN